MASWFSPGSIPIWSFAAFFNLCLHPRYFKCSAEHLLYTKVDLDALRALALPWPGGVR